MMQVIKKWKVVVKFIDREVTVYVSDNHIENVLRHVAIMDFTSQPLESPVSIHIGD